LVCVRHRWCDGAARLGTTNRDSDLARVRWNYLSF
jgi:hypothetical protein